MSNREKLVTSTHAGVKEQRDVAGKFCYISNMEKLVTSTHAGVKEEKKLLVSSVTYQIWKKLVTSTHVGVKEERNVAGKLCYISNMSIHAGVAGKFCYMSNMQNWSPVLMLVLKRRIMVLVSTVTCKICKTGHQYSCWC